MQRIYVPPNISCSLGRVHRDDAKGWKLIALTPDGIFPSMVHAGKHYNVNETTIRSWCLENSRYKKLGFSCKKLFVSLNEAKELIDNEKI